jgi:hypothetical protein
LEEFPVAVPYNDHTRELLDHLIQHLIATGNAPKNPSSQRESLSWYQDYNRVKHDRATEFSRANLDNVINAVSGLFSIVFSQFNILAFSAHEIVSSHDDWDGWLAHYNSAFSIKLPTWNSHEYYSFNNINFKTMRPKFDSFQF